MKKWLLLAGLFIIAGFIFYKKTPVEKRPVISWDIILPVTKPDPAIPVISVDIIDWPAVRSPNLSLGKILADVDSHLPAGHPYSDEDRITFCHESVHGVNNAIRNKYGWKYNAFYVLNNKAILVLEPPTTIQKVANIIPKSWQGKVWQTYLVNQLGDWNDQPLYLGDEWTAYINGTLCGHELGIGGSRYASSMESSCEFIGYLIGLAYIIKKECPTYDDKQFRAWFMYNAERIMNLYKNEASERLELLRNSSDSMELRKFAYDYFGSKWCQTVLGMK